MLVDVKEEEGGCGFDLLSLSNIAPATIMFAFYSQHCIERSEIPALARVLRKRLF